MDFDTARSLATEHGTALLCISASRLRENLSVLQASLPGVDLYYAVKSNSFEGILALFAGENLNFDLASTGEITMVKAVGVTGDRCIHTHPIKRDRDIVDALDFGITTFVADNVCELDKLVPHRDRLSVLIRLSIQNPHCLVNLSHKFGVPPTEAFDLVQAAHERGLDVEGLAFHIGSQNESVVKYIEALEYCRDICRMAALNDIALRTIDIGGGFPIDYLSPTLPLIQFCQPINEYLERYFANYRIIAEPGRFLSGSSGTLIASVIGKSVRDGVRWYYLDEGVYGCFSGKIFDHADYPMLVDSDGERYTSTLAGPTCDSVDILYENIALPEMNIGDILLFNSMGAYTNASACDFNGLPESRIIMVD